MFNVEAYLSKLGLSSPMEPTLETLKELHKRHLMSLPFDSALYAELGMTVLENADIDVDKVFDRIIVGGEGGSCYDLSGIFRQLLRDLGYDIMIMSGGIRAPDGKFGLDIEHMFIGVRLDGELWLADVGFPGPSFIDPIRVTDEVQEQYGCQYQILEDKDYRVLRRKGQEGDWQAVYRFKVQPRELSEWKAVTDLSPEDGWNWDGEVVAAGTIIRGRTFSNGQMILIGRRYTKIDKGREHTRTLTDPAEYQDVLNHILLKDA